MDLLGLKELIQREDEVIDLRIENFSSADNESQAKTLTPKLFNGTYAFNVSAYPNGISSNYSGYVSLVVKSSMTANQDLVAVGSSNSMSCTASIVDAMGIGRYNQSFGIENLILPECCVSGLERFISRSALQRQKEDLLPEDVLTVRFEFSFTSNQEMAMLSKITEFLPTLFVSTSAHFANGMDSCSNCDFFGIFNDIEDRSEDGCKEYACASLFDNQLHQNKNKSVKISGDGILEESEVPQTLKDVLRIEQNETNQVLSSEQRIENKADQTSVCEIYSETNASQASVSGAFIGNEAGETFCSELCGENETAQASSIVNKNHASDYNMIEEVEESFKVPNVRLFHQQTMFTKINDEVKYQEKISSESTDKNMGSFETGDEPTKNVIIVINAHRLFRRSNRSPKNGFDFALMASDELYNLFYSIESLDDEESKSIYRIHQAAPFFKNLMDRDECVTICVDLQEATKRLETTVIASTTTQTNKMLQNKIEDLYEKSENHQYWNSSSEYISSGKFKLATAKTPINSSQQKHSSTKADVSADKSTDVENFKSSQDRDQGTWEFLIQTIDNVIRVPFEENKETIGYKLLAISPVFEKMLKYPMKERRERRVEMKDATARTINNLLSYVDSGRFLDIPLPDAYDLYELADKYAVKDLMKACSDFMAFFPIRENVWSMVKLAELHCDDYLLELAENMQKLVFRLERIAMQKKEKFMGMFKELVVCPDDSVTERKMQSDFFEQGFNFYQ